MPTTVAISTVPPTWRQRRRPQLTPLWLITFRSAPRAIACPCIVRTSKTPFFPRKPLETTEPPAAAQRWAATPKRAEMWAVWLKDRSTSPFPPPTAMQPGLPGDLEAGHSLHRWRVVGRFHAHHRRHQPDHRQRRFDDHHSVCRQPEPQHSRYRGSVVLGAVLEHLRSGQRSRDPQQEAVVALPDDV